ncbi:MAG: hypothetical protein WC487_02395 [Candidatus Omnitrophota bacterium]
MRTRFFLFFWAVMFFIDGIVLNGGILAVDTAAYALRPMSSNEALARGIIGDLLKGYDNSAVRTADLLSAVDEMNDWREQNVVCMHQKSGNNCFMTLLQDKMKEVFEKHRLYELPINSRLAYCSLVCSNDVNRNVHNVIKYIYKSLKISSTGSGKISISPEQYYELANILSESEYLYSILENRYIRFCFALIFDFWDSERRMLEQAYLVEQIDKELNAPGEGRLPVVATMQDLHGGSRRAMSLAGFALGLPPDIYSEIKNLDDLKTSLLRRGIIIGDECIRFIGLNDKYDRGNEPVQVLEFVKWLRESGKAKPFIGNHDFWRTMSVLGIHFLPEDMGVSFEKTHGIGYWSKDAFAHSGWGDIELERINEKRFNQSLANINVGLMKYREKLPPIDLSIVRERFEKELKELKKKNADIRKENELNKDNPSYSRQDELALPDILRETLSYLRLKKKEYNSVIMEINQKYFCDIAPMSIPLIHFNEVNLDNYRQDREIVDAALWELKNFRLFYVDILGNLHMHNILPIDYKNGGFAVFYKGLRGLPALELMAEDVRSFFEDMDALPDSAEFRKEVWGKLGGIFTTINDWYSDKTAYAKAVSVRQFVDAGGLESLGHEILGHVNQVFVDRESSFLVFWGHNERKKFEDRSTALPWIYLYPASGSGLANIDNEMSEGYSDMGAIVTFFKRTANGNITGLRMWGYRKGSTEIEDLTMENITGICKEQKDMLVELSGGVSFMQWYRKKAVDHILKESRALLDTAKGQNRPDKILFAERMIERFEPGVATDRNINHVENGMRLGRDVVKNKIDEMIRSAA